MVNGTRAISLMEGLSVDVEKWRERLLLANALVNIYIYAIATPLAFLVANCLPS